MAEDKALSVAAAVLILTGEVVGEVEEEDPSRLRAEKVGTSVLPKDMTRRLPTSARAAWLVAARWLRRPLAAAPQLSTDKGTHACVCQREFLSLFDFHNLFKRWRWKSIFPSPI